MGRITQVASALRLLPRAAGLIRRHGRPPGVLYFGGSPGDDLLATAVVQQWHKFRGTKPWYLTRHPGLFEGNPDVGLVQDYSPELAGALSFLGVERVRLKYHDYDAAEDRSVAPKDHIINLMGQSAGLPAISNPVPRIYLTVEEFEKARRPRPFLILQSSVLGAAMPIRNKEWFPARMSGVAAHFSARMDVLQLGSPSDPAVPGSIDLRGKTSLREAAALLAHASGFVGMVGFLMHLAAAVKTPSVIVFGGREHPGQSGYSANVNLFTQIKCSPCWLWNRCEFDHECMQKISADDVIRAVEKLLGAGRSTS